MGMDVSSDSSSSSSDSDSDNDRAMEFWDSDSWHSVSSNKIPAKWSESQLKCEQKIKFKFRLLT